MDEGNRKTEQLEQNQPNQVPVDAPVVAEQTEVSADITEKLIEETTQEENHSATLDYDRLTDAIIKAVQQAQCKDGPQKDDRMNKIASVFSYCVSVIEFVMCAINIIAMVLAIERMDWANAYPVIGNIVVLAVYASITAIIAIVGCWTWRVAKTIKGERDRNYTVAVFSSLAAFAAFVMAGISLLLTTRG